MLAQAVATEFRNEQLILTDVHQTCSTDLILDITDAAAVDAFIKEQKPEVIINCAAYTAVDAAEGNQKLAEKINALGPQNLAEAAHKHHAKLIHISTDYVFPGDKPVSEAYTETDEPGPVSVYGLTKLRGEQAIINSTDDYYIFRTAWLYGPGGKNFVETMLSLSKDHAELKVVNDQHGSPTSTATLASIIHQALDLKLPAGLYHATNLDFTTWYDFTRQIFAERNISTEVVPVKSSEYPTAAPRPHNSQLSKDKLLALGIKIPDWQTALHEYLSTRK